MMEASKPYLGRCKSCEFTIFATEEDLREVTDFSEVKPGLAYAVFGRGNFSRCDQKHRVFPLRQIKGTYSPDHKCDARCLNAKGNECTCSCGGANHGRGHAVVVHTVGSEPAPEPEKRFLGEIGKSIRGEARLTHKRDITDATLYSFLTKDGTASIKWYCPSYANPEWEVGKTLTLRAKVKRHEDHERYGKSTVVTYLEEV